MNVKMGGLQCVFKFGLGWQCACRRIFTVILVFMSTTADCGIALPGDCGEINLKGPSGEIMSPNYPYDYPNLDGCRWYITLTSTEVATLSFTDFSLEEGKDCYLGDSLSIAPNLVVYCGFSLPPPYISEVDTSQIRVTFVSDAFVTQRGFRIEYVIGERYVDSCKDGTEFHCAVGNCIPLKWACNGLNECSDGSDESFSHCHQVTTAGYTSPPLQCLSHQFLCRPISTGVLTCLPELLKCDGHKDCIDNEDEDGCTSVCNYFLNDAYGRFTSPSFPRNYDPNLNCFWALDVGEGNIIQLRFDVFDLEEKYDTDYVTVYDGEETTDEIGTYYGYAVGGHKSIHMPPSVIEGSGSQLRVVFRTDGSSSSRGFNATYQTKGNCIKGQQLCSSEDKNCYDSDQKCDDIMTCLRGEDELGCSDSCRDIQISCFKSPKGCFSIDERCNGKKDCLNGEDEKDCHASLCRYEMGLFRCNDGTCMLEKFTCDSSRDCPNGDDEENCGEPDTRP